MVDNITVLDSTGATNTLKAKDNAGIKTPYNNVQFSDNQPSTNSGNKDAGTLRVVLATDQPNLTTPINVSVTGTVTVNGSAVTQPISAVSLPLPTGAATAAKQPALGTAGAASADVITVQGIASGVSQNVVLTAGSAIAGNFRIDQTTPGTTNGVRINAGSSIIGQVGIDQTTPGTTNAVTLNPQTGQGLTSVTMTTSVTGVIKSSAGSLYNVCFLNTNAAVRWLNFYNKASAPTLGVDSTVTRIPLPPNVWVEIDLKPFGWSFSTGIAYSFTTDNAFTPTTAGASGDCNGTAWCK